MEITKIAVLGLIGAVLSVVLKQRSPVFSMMVSVITALIIFIYIIPKLNEIIIMFNTINSYINIKTEYIQVLVKSVIISYIAMFASRLCRDFNESAIGDKIELAAKVSVMVLSAPLITDLIGIVLNIFR